MNTIDIYTLCRSGNHAIIFWILENLGGINKKIHNCCYWNDVTKIFFYNNCNHIKYNIVKQYNYLIRSYEDIYNNKTNNNIKVIIIRDFLNLLASRIKKYGVNLGLNSSYIQNYNVLKEMWKNHCKEITTNNKVIGILYNKWLLDKNYRDNISNKLNIVNKYDNTNIVSTIGEGSSFCGINLEKVKEAYLQRYKLVNIPINIINDIKQDNELIQLNLELFDIDINELLNANKCI